jgi:hypothetical protein
MALFSRSKPEPKKALDAPKMSAQATPNQSAGDHPANPTGDNMPVVKKADLFSYHTGVGKENKAAYKIGKVEIPAAVISRLIKEVEGKPENRQNHIIYAALEKKYSKFLDAVEAAEMDYSEALSAMVAIKPKKAVSTSGRASKVEKAAELFSKVICRRFKGTPEEMVSGFLETVNKPEFKAEAMDCIKSYIKSFGQVDGKVKTSNRKGNPAAIKALAKARAAKK